MSQSPGILILSNDQSVPFAKTSEFLGSAAQRLGWRTYVRDTFDYRLRKLTLEEIKTPERECAVAKQVAEHWESFLETEKIDLVLGLDLYWFFYPKIFLSNPRIKSIISLWFDDFRSWCTHGMNVWYGDQVGGFQSLIRDPKITHVFYGQGLALESEMFGIRNQMLSRLGAPAEFLREKNPCEITDRAVFIGNPGFRGKPPEIVIQRIREGADVEELRRLSREHLLHACDPQVLKWFAAEPTVRDLLAVATEVKISNPFVTALEVIRLTGTHYPKAYNFLNEQALMIDFALLVKLVTRYDRPGLVARLYHQGLVDVFSNGSEWEPYGVKAERNLNVYELPRYYQKYSIHLNGANCLRDATANEKLFEIAACGRASVNIKSPDIVSCYSTDEIIMGDTFDSLESQVRHFLKNPDEALAMGERARRRTAREHLWDHRLKAIGQKVL